MNYQSGDVVCVGDLVRYMSADGIVEMILPKGTEDAEDYRCGEEGGVLVRILSDNDLFVLQPWEEEDLILLHRASAKR